MKTYLVLDDGTVFEGQSMGATDDTIGEMAFTTGMTGYLETLTDPSYYGQIILQTFPLIGNYGVIPADFESTGVAAKGYIVKHPCRTPSNFRSEGDLDAFLKERAVTGLCGIDTRALTKIIRKKGAMNGKITHSAPTASDIEEAKAYRIQDAIASVSGQYTPAQQQTPGTARYKIALMDFGMKRAIPEALIARGCEVKVFSHDAGAEQILRTRPDGIMLSNGPGDPAARENAYIIETVRALLKSGVPVFGICIGHQFMALASGYATRKMKFGHRGGNQPVRDMKTGRVYITSQNHGYTVVAGESAFLNINDGGCEGLDYGASFSVQFHPEARGGPQDTMFLFDRFIERINAAR